MNLFPTVCVWIVPKPLGKRGSGVSASPTGVVEVAAAVAGQSSEVRNWKNHGNEHQLASDDITLTASKSSPG